MTWGASLPEAIIAVWLGLLVNPSARNGHSLHSPLGIGNVRPLTDFGDPTL
jgi:hypothetical protein